MQLETRDAPGIVSGGVFLTVLLIAGAIVWASITELSEVARTPGEVVPAGLIHKVQHLEGGIVDDIYVQNGDEVAVGQILVSLAASPTRAELQQLQTRRAGLALDLERLTALLEERAPVFESDGNLFPTLVASQHARYVDQMASHREQIALIQAQIRQREAELASLDGQIDAAREEIELLQQLEQMQEQLAAKQIVARVDLINVKVRHADATRDYRELQGQLRVARDALAEAEQRRVELDSRLREALSSEASELAVQLAEVEQSILRTRDRLHRLEVRAPVAGIVKGLGVNTIHEVVESGEVIMEIVPIGKELIVESRISTTDIGHVQTGQPVDVKVTSYESTRFGSVPGTLRRISASTYLDRDEQPYYLAEIALERDFLGTASARHRILPGMTVQADILTGRKTILDYVLKPVYRGFQAAFRER
jgi:HlyD family type I secretion membrane fusion protein